MTPTTKRRLLALLVAAPLAMAFHAAAQTAGVSVKAGHDAYVAKGCFECHGYVGQGAIGVGARLAPPRLPVDAFRAYVRHPAGSMPPYSAKLVSDAEVAAFTTTQIGGFTGSQLGALTTTEFARFTSTQINAFTPAQLGALSLDSLMMLDDTQLATLSTTEVQGLTGGQLSALSDTQFARFVTTQIKAFTASQIGSLSVTNLNGLDATTMGSLSATQIRGLTAFQVFSLTATDVAELTAAQIPAFSSDLLDALSTMQKGQKLRMLIDREPLPLYRILQNNGYAWSTRNLPDYLFEILIWEKN